MYYHIRSNKHWKACGSWMGESAWGACRRRTPMLVLYGRMRPMSHFHWNDWGASWKIVQLSKHMHGLSLLLLTTAAPDKQKALIFNIFSFISFYWPHEDFTSTSRYIQRDGSVRHRPGKFEYDEALRGDSYDLKCLSYFVSDKDPWLIEILQYWNIKQ